eukprot:7592887-Ditylum_brightwellii.AAC.1
MSEHTLGAIALGPVGNVQGSYKFMNLWTGKVIAWRKYDELPAAHRVIKQVNQLGITQAQDIDFLFYDHNQNKNANSNKDDLTDGPQPEINHGNKGVDVVHILEGTDNDN